MLKSFFSNPDRKTAPNRPRIFGSAAHCVYLCQAEGEAFFGSAGDDEKNAPAAWEEEPDGALAKRGARGGRRLLFRSAGGRPACRVRVRVRPWAFLRA